MSNRNILFVFQFFVFFSLSLSLLAQQAPYQWNYHFPLDIEPKVSGSFGEIRSNHFHSGLDLTTHGKIGLPVYAADSGFVSRIAVSPVGFGKAIYIDHPSGYTTVYAHLDGFPPAIDSIVTEMQYDNKSFAIQHYFSQEDITVGRGEVIGFSGNSGSSGGPHLHFEVRETAGQRPIDPLAFSTPVKDNIRPHIAGIKLYPLSDDATINGKTAAQYYPAVFYDGAFHLKHNPQIEAAGKIGIGIEVLDYLSGSWRKCGVHSIDLRIENRAHFNYVMNGFYFHDTRYLNSHIDFAEKMNSRRIIQKSFVDPFNRIDLYQMDAQRGQMTMIPGRNYPLTYMVKDISGNVSKLEFNILGDDTYADNRTNQKTGELYVDASQPFSFEMDDHSVLFPEESFYDDLFTRFEVNDFDKSVSGTVFSLLDKTIPVHKQFEIRIPVPAGMEVRGLCGATVSKKGKFNYAGGNREGNFFVIKAREGGDYALTRDTIPPEISIKNKPHQMNYRGRKTLVAEIKDDFSGIDQYNATINGKWVMFEYDAKNNRLICFLEKIPFLEKGEHALKFEITDQAGNKTKFETDFRY